MPCKICNSECSTIYDFGKQAIANDFKLSRLEPKIPKQNLRLVRCNKCNTIQLADTVDPSLLYNDLYPYKSYANRPLVNHFESLVKHIERDYHPTPDNVVLDIGSNDGTFISLFKDSKDVAVGVDPASCYDPDLTQWHRFFNKEFAKEFLTQSDKPSVITCLNVFAHVPDIHEFIDAIKILMNKNTVLIIEVQHNKQICQGIFDQIYHEHCFYFDCRTLTNLLNSHGIKVNGYQIFTELNGGTLRVECSLGKQITPIPFDPYSSATIKQLHNSIKDNINSISNMVESLLIRNNHLELVGYGAPAKAALMVNQVPVLKSMAYTADSTVEKDNTYIPGSDIKVIYDGMTNMFYDDKQRAIFMFSWNYFTYIMHQNNNFIDNYVMVPFPNQSIYLCEVSNLKKEAV